MTKRWLSAVDRDCEVLDFCGIVPLQSFLDDERLECNVLLDNGVDVGEYCEYLNSFAGIVREVDLVEDWGMIGEHYTNEGAVDDLVMALISLVCRTAQVMGEVIVRSIDYNVSPFGNNKILVKLNMQYDF